jgi:hypothetical protein
VAALNFIKYRFLEIVKAAFALNHHIILSFLIAAVTAQVFAHKPATA